MYIGTVYEVPSYIVHLYVLSADIHVHTVCVWCVRACCALRACVRVLYCQAPDSSLSRGRLSLYVGSAVSAVRHFGISASRHFGISAFQQFGISALRHPPSQLSALDEIEFGRFRVRGA